MITWIQIEIDVIVIVVLRSCRTNMIKNHIIYVLSHHMQPANMAVKLASSSGYECNFVPEPDDALKCLICLAVARDPWQHGKCGRLFCEDCLPKHGKDKPCLNCRMEQPQYLEDMKSKT